MLNIKDVINQMADAEEGARALNNISCRASNSDFDTLSAKEMLDLKTLCMKAESELNHRVMECISLVADGKIDAE